MECVVLYKRLWNRYDLSLSLHLGGEHNVQYSSFLCRLYSSLLLLPIASLASRENGVSVSGPESETSQ